MTDSVQVNLAVGQVYVERTQPSEYVVYRPGTLEVCQVLETWKAAVAFARAEWHDLPVVMVREYLICGSSAYVKAP